ncbi:MAG: two-CW domain-containing protein [Nitrospirota bacterium]
MGEKLNCWEFMQCGRGPGGAKVEGLGACSAATFTSSEELNGETNGGRMCWAIAGIYAFGELARSSSRSLYDCHDCDFRWKVLLEERIIKSGMVKRTAVPENSNQGGNAL